jgi:TonB family protein
VKLPKDQPFWTSVILHLVVLVGLFLATIVQAFKPKEKPHVFEMVEPPSETSDSPNSPSPLPPVVTPADVELPPVPQVDIPPPEPTRRPVEAPPKPKLVNYEDFIKKNPKKDPTPRTQTPRQQITVPQIDVPQLVVPQNPAQQNTNRPLSQQQLTELQRYSARLRSKIDAAWVKPAQLAGVRLISEVVFDVSASGRVTNARLRPGSGNSAFDQSVLAAFRKVSSAGLTPTGQAHTFKLPFRMRD